MPPKLAADLRKHPVTYLLIAVNLLTYAAQLIDPRLQDRFATLGRGYLNDGTVYLYDGHPEPGDSLAGIEFGEWYRLLTGAFLHLEPGQDIGVAHIAGNMVWLWLFGRAIEPLTGHLRMLLLYLGSAIGGSLAVYRLAPDDLVVGASGAVYGLVAALFGLNLRNRTERAGAASLAAIFLVWLAFSAYSTSWQAHLGGFLTGAALAGIHLFLQPSRRTIDHDVTPPWHPDRL